MGKNSLLVYCLFDFVDTKQLEIGLLESISIPRNFQTQSQKDKLKTVGKMRNEKTDICVR